VRSPGPVRAARGGSCPGGERTTTATNTTSGTTPGDAARAVAVAQAHGRERPRQAPPVLPGPDERGPGGAVPPAGVPILPVTGPAGVGTTSVAAAASARLTDAGDRLALSDAGASDEPVAAPGCEDTPRGGPVRHDLAAPWPRRRAAEANRIEHLPVPTGGRSGGDVAREALVRSGWLA
jgi:hypothetical protein